MTTTYHRTRLLIETEISAATYAMREADAAGDFAQADGWDSKRNDLLEELVAYLPTQR